MSQNNVLNFIKRQKEPISVKAIANALKLGASTVTSNLRKLAKQNEIGIIINGTKKSHKFYLYFSKSKRIKLENADGK